MSIPISIEKVSSSRLSTVDLNNILFGRIFSDHMLVADFIGEKWNDVRIVPFQNLTLSPATTALHYGQEIFEGLKAYKDKNGTPVIFRPRDNWKRMNLSAERLCMPSIPEDIFIEGTKKLLSLDRDWIPTDADSSLYIRPFMFATDEYVGIKPSENYKFIIFTCPVNAYYPEPIKVKIETKYSRAARGGFGFAKAAGNYAGSLFPASLGQKEGYRQLIWTDPNEHKYFEEAGTMNIFFVIDGKIITPSTDYGTILKGITRDSVITLLRDEGYEVEERPVSVNEVVSAYDEGKLNDVFGTGTAATIAHIKAIGYFDRDLELPPIEKRDISNKILKKLDQIRKREIADPHGWVEVI